MRISKFVIVGGVNTALAYGLYVLLVSVGVNYQLALLMDYIFGVFLSYFANRYWTFADCKYSSRSFLRYIATYLLVFVLNSMLLMIFVEMDLMEPITGQFLTLTIVTLLSYLIQNLWVFRNKP